MTAENEKTIEYIVMDPTGNITALVTSNAEISRQPFIAGKIMEQHPEVEQVGFVDLSGTMEDAVQAKLRMAGGEFCGNASMCTAALYAERNQLSGRGDLEICLDVSGAEDVVRVRLTCDNTDLVKASVTMPKAISCKTEELQYQDITASLPLVRMQGISHLIIEEESPFSCLKPDKDAAEAAVKKWCRELSAEGLGMMFLSGTKPELEMTPLVYIPESGTVFWENSCGSGSSACGMYLAENTKEDVSLTIKQPGGMLHVDSRYFGDTVMSGTVRQLFRSSL